MTESTDLDAAGARDGSPDAFARLYARVGPALAAWARMRSSGSMAQYVDPDDLTQEIWWRALDAFPRFDAERAPFRAWIFGIAANTFRTMVRRAPANRIAASEGDARFVELPLQLQAQLTSITADARRRDRVTELVSLINELDEEDRRLFIYCGLEGLQLKDTGAILGISENAAKKRWQKLRQRLESTPIIEEFIEPW